MKKLASVYHRMNLGPEYGWHRDCYTMFTGNLNRLISPQEPQAEPEQQRRSGRVPGSGDKYIFKKDCIFCNKEGLKAVKVKNVWTTEPTTVFDRDGWRNVLEIAEQHKDEKLLLRIRGYNLFSCEAQYHPHCRLQYTRDPTAWQSKDIEGKRDQEDLEKAHNEAFERVCVRLEEEVIQRHRIVKLSDLCDTYVIALRETKYPNENYRREKLKKKLEKTYGDKLVFGMPHRKAGEYQSLLVYSAEMNTQAAVITAYELGSADTLKDTALYLRSVIIEAFQKSGALPWPPSDDFLQNRNVLPQDFQRFLNFLLDGQAQDQASKVQRLVTSLGQDIMRAVTKGHWKLPKHILLCMTLRHLFRSKQLVTMMNRFGHCDSYMFSLELETAIASAVNECSSVLTSDILLNPAAPSVFHSEFDNFDVFLSTLEGQSSTHTAHGIMMQEVGSGEENRGTQQQLHAMPRTRELMEMFVV